MLVQHKPKQRLGSKLDVRAGPGVDVSYIKYYNIQQATCTLSRRCIHGPGDCINKLEIDDEKNVLNHFTKNAESFMILQGSLYCLF
jgi:hypothetical protein